MANPNVLNSLYEGELVVVKIFFEYIYIFLHSKDFSLLGDK